MERYREDSSRGGYLQIPVCDKSIAGEMSGDFTLPDYHPDIKRLLKIGACILPSSSYVGGNGACYEGGILKTASRDGSLTYSDCISV